LANKAGLRTNRVVGTLAAPPPAAGARRRAPRRSPLLLLACLLALATGLTLDRLSDLLAPAAPARTAPSPAALANTAVVRRFYAEVDAALATGDPAPLDATLASDFVDHAAAPGQPANRTGVSQEVVALHAVFPTLRLVVTDLVAQGDEVVARVQAKQTDPPAFLGIPLPTDWAVWGLIDVFRIANDRIVERWSGNATAAFLQSFPPASLILPPIGPAFDIESVTIPPGGTGDSPGTVGPTLLWVEAGAPTVTLDSFYAPRAELTRAAGAPDAGTPAAIAPGSTATLAAGDLVWLEDTHFTIRNPGSVPAVVLAAVTTAATELFGGNHTRGLSTQRLADIRGTALHPGPTVVAVGRATLAAGASLPVHRVTGIEVVADEAGTATLSMSGGAVGIRRAGRGPTRSSPAEATTLGAGDAALIEDGTTDEIRNVGDTPLSVLVVTIASTRPSSAPPVGSPESDPSVGPKDG
jgi:predicted ester cyclase